MTRTARAMLGAFGGVLWGAGLAVLVQQYGLWPLDPLTAYGAPAAAAFISGTFGRARGHRKAGATAATAVVLLPVLVLAFQSGTCSAFVDSGERGFLAESTPGDPIRINPEFEGGVVVTIDGEGAQGARGKVWIEMGGIPIFTKSGRVDGALVKSFDLADTGFDQFAGAPGIYHVGGSIDGVCDVDGYVRIDSNPWETPVAPAAAGAIGLGLLITWIAGRPPNLPRTAPRRSMLRSDGKSLQIRDVEVRSPGLEGEIEVHEPTDAAVRRIAGWTEEARQAFAHHHVDAHRIVEISDARETGGIDVGRDLVTPAGRPALQLDLPNPGPDHGQVVLATDEGGLATWHFPRLEVGGIDLSRIGPTCRYLIDRRVAPSDPPERRRGIAEAFGAKVLSSLVFPLLDPVFERVGERFARGWEAKRRPYRFRSFTPDDYDAERAPQPDWDLLATGRSLLFVHGTFSRAHTGFAGLPANVLDDLHHLYSGRVFAFDHFTLSDDPRANVEWFYNNLPHGMRLDVDIVCHSRGGLVSRVLAERQADVASGDRRVDVGKIVFVASPNAGTILAEPAYIGDYIDTYTNLLNFVPGSSVADMLEGVITVVKHVAVGAVRGLAGLQAMRPGGEFLRWLNATSTNPGRYFAIAGDYEPAASGWRDFAVNRLMDGIFHEANDLVVPTLGTYGANGSNHFPIATRHEFRREDGVDHTGYFASKQVRDRLLEWLQD